MTLANTAMPEAPPAAYRLFRYHQHGSEAYTLMGLSDATSRCHRGSCRTPRAAMMPRRAPCGIVDAIDHLRDDMSARHDYAGLY